MNKKKELEELKRRFESLKPITTRGFDTDKELDEFEEANKSVFEEYYRIGQKIEELERELMTPEEQKKEDELLRLMKKKRQGEL
jgi:hypothetical protein